MNVICISDCWNHIIVCIFWLFSSSGKIRRNSFRIFFYNSSKYIFRISTKLILILFLTAFFPQAANHSAARVFDRILNIFLFHLKIGSLTLHTKKVCWIVQWGIPGSAYHCRHTFLYLMVHFSSRVPSQTHLPLSNGTFPAQRAIVNLLFFTWRHIFRSACHRKLAFLHLMAHFSSRRTILNLLSFIWW